MRKLLLGVLILVLGCMLVQGETFEHEEGGISIWFPDNWKIEDTENLLEAYSPDEEAFAHLLVLQDVNSLDAAVNAYVNELDKIVRNFRSNSGDGQELEMNGLKIFYIEGEGKVEGETVDVGVALIASRSAITMMVTFNTKRAAKKYARDFENIVKSLKAL